MFLNHLFLLPQKHLNLHLLFSLLHTFYEMDNQEYYNFSCIYLNKPSLDSHAILDYCIHQDLNQ